MVGAVIQVAARAALGALGIHAGTHDEDGDSADDCADGNGNQNIYAPGLLIIDDIFLIAVVIVARGIRITVNGRAVTVGGKIGGQSSQKRVEGAIIIAVFQVRKGAFADLLNAVVRQGIDGVSFGGDVPVPFFHGQEEQRAVICIAVVIVIIVGIVLRTFSVQSVHRQDDHVHSVFLPKRLRLFFQRRFLRGGHEIGVVNDVLLLCADAQEQGGEKQQAQDQANQFVFHTVSLLKASEAAPATQAARHRR